MFSFRKKPEYITISSNRPRVERAEPEPVPAGELLSVDASSEDEAAPEAAEVAEEAPVAEQAPVAAPPGSVPTTRAGRKLNLVDRNMLLQAIDDAVRNGVRRQFKKIDADTLNTIVFSTRTELVRSLKASSRSVRGMPKAAFLKEVEEERARILAERDRVKGELEQMQVQLDQRRVAAAAAERKLVTESREESIRENQELTERIFEMFGGAEASPEMAAVREQVTFMLLQTVDGEREKVLEAQLNEHRREVDKFERRISKLTESLSMTEEELQRLAKAKGIEHGVASIYRTVQGLSDGEDSAEVKMEMMSSIFEANLALQKGQDAAA